MFDYRWLKILESLYDNGHQLKRDDILQFMHQRGVQVDDQRLERDLFILQDEGLIMKGLASGMFSLTDSGKKKVQVVRRGY